MNTNTTANESTTVPNVTSAEFVQWIRDHKGLAEAALKAKAFADVERERVRKYILPIFESFNFVDDQGEKITDPDDLYLSEDGARMEEFYDRADEAHRAHGFIGEPRVWPDLQADTIHMEAERALVEAACKLFNLSRQPVGKKREEFLRLIYSACLNVPTTVSGGK